MLVLITYDVNTETPEGRKHLRQVAKKCQDYGQRVQCSVFEISIDYAGYLQLKHDLISIIDIERDSLRFYNLGNNYSTKIEHFGTKESYNPEGTLIV